MGGNTGRKNYVDVTKGVGILLVIIGHSASPELLSKYISAFHMPLFFIVSGYLYDDLKWKKHGLYALVRKRLATYVVPYFALSFLNLILNGFYEVRKLSGSAFLQSTLEHIYWIFYSGATATRTPNCTPLWFLLSLFIASALMYIYMLVQNPFYRWFLNVLSISLMIAVIDFGLPALPWQMDVAVFGAVFMQLGFEVKKRDILAELRSVHIIFIFAVGSVAAYFNGPTGMVTRTFCDGNLYWGAAISLSVVTMWFCRYHLQHSKFLAYFGRHTIIVMGFNYFFNMVTGKIWTIWPCLRVEGYLWLEKSIFVTMFCCVVMLLWDSIKKTKYLNFAG